MSSYNFVLRHAAKGVASVVILLAITLALHARSGNADPSSGRLHDQLWNEEQKLGSAEKQQSRTYFEQKLDNDVIFVAYNGEVFTKEKILQVMKYLDVSRYLIQNFRVRALGSDSALVTYDLDLNAKIGGHELPAKQYASSVWLKRGEAWVLVFHQTTPADHR